MDDDLTRLAQWRAGDEAAGSALVRRHLDAVFRFFHGKVPLEAKDLTQQTLLGCLESRTELRADGSFRALLFAIARNQLLMHLRSRARRGRLLVPERTSLRELYRDGRPSPTDALAHRERREQLSEALARLPIDFQIAVELHYWERLSIGEIAEVLDVAPGTVKSRLHRARQLLHTETLQGLQC